MSKNEVESQNFPFTKNQMKIGKSGWGKERAKKWNRSGRERGMYNLMPNTSKSGGQERMRRYWVYLSGL